MSDELFEAPSLEYLSGHLPQFEFEDFIAQGGMGAVYRACQISLDRTVAIKVLPHELGENEEFRDSFSKEAKAMAKLNHPNLIGVFDSGDVDGMPYIVMEYIEGSSLHDACWGEKLESDRAVAIVKGICDGLVDAHKHGIIHRDIKPANILLTIDAVPKIGDFGLAHPSDSDELGLIMGTPGYTAPEVYQDPNLAGVLADQYSVGMILHQLLTGIDPAGTDGPPTVPTGNIKLDGIWRKATQLDPAKRYPSIADMSADLELWKQAKAAPPAAAVAAPAGRALNVGAPQMAASPPIQLKSAKSGGKLLKVVLLGLLAAGGWFGYGYYKDNQEAIDQKITGKEQPGVPSTDNPRTASNSPAGKPPKQNPKASGGNNRNTAGNTSSGKDRLTPKERRELRDKRRSANRDNATPRVPTPTIPDPTPAPRPAAPTIQPGDPELREKAIALILDARAKRDALLDKNSQEFRRLVEYEAARAARDDSRMYEQLRKDTASGWLPEPDDMPNVSEAVSREHRNAYRLQDSIKSKHEAELTRIRDYYVPMLEKAAKATSDEEKKERLIAQANRASDLNTWVATLAPEANR